MKAFNLIVLLLSIIGTAITVLFSNQTPQEYKIIWILPVIFTVLYCTVFQRVIRNSNMRITVVSLIVLLFLKTVLNPVLISLAGPTYPGKRYVFLSPDVINLAISVTAYELIIVSFFVFFLSILKQNNEYIKPTKTFILGGSKLFYGIYIAFAIVLFIIFGRSANILSFFSFSLNENGYTQVESTSLILVRQIMVVAIAISFILVVNYAKVQYIKTNKKVFILIGILAALINVSVIVGNRRSVQLFTSILSILVLVKTFKSSKKLIVFSILSVASTVFFLMTLYRWGAGEQGSYAGALSSTEMSVQWMADYAQIYFAGPDAIATSIVFANNIDLSFKNLVFDFGRTIFGLSFLLKDNMQITSELYNLYLYNGAQLTGQLVFSNSYGFIYFGFLGAPIIMILNTWISVYLEKLYRKSYSYELAYLFGYCLLRMSLNLLTNTPTIITVITQMLGTLGLVIVVSRLFVSGIEINNRKKIINVDFSRSN